MIDPIEGKQLHVPSLLAENPQRRELAIFTVHHRDLERMKGLDRLPLTSLGLRWISAPDLKRVPLPGTLRDLAIWHCSKLRSLDGLEAAADLRTLVLEDNGPLEDAGALAGLKHLSTLSIQGGFVSKQKILSLEALEGLPIRNLTLRAVQAGGVDLSPVARLSQLERLDIHGPNFDPAELAKVAAAHPWFLDQLLDLEDYGLKGMKCKKCNGTQKQMFLRRKKFLWCPKCDEKGLQRTIEGFLDLVEKARTNQ